ncbi:MAG: hypothetical protein WCP46_00240 [Alphaproteobacteria bacterium]
MRQLQVRTESLPQASIGETMTIDAAWDYAARMQEIPAETTDNPSITISTTAPVKRKRTVKPKIIPPFWEGKDNGAEAPASIFKLGTNSRGLSSASRYFMCPFSEFIPLVYLSVAPQLFNKRYHYINEKYIDSRQGRSLTGEHVDMFKATLKDKENPLSYFIYNLITDGSGHDSIKGSVDTYVNAYLGQENPLLLENSGWIHRYDNITENVFKEGLTTINMRTFSASMGSYSLFRNTSAEILPVVLPIVLPENYMYQKLHILLHGTIDMTKVIFLVDKDLQGTSYPHKAFRTMYKKYVEPHLLATKAQIYYVPFEFMKDYCYIGGNELKEKSIIGRKKEISQIISQFKAKFEDPSFVSEALQTEEDDEYEEDDYEADYSDAEIVQDFETRRRTAEDLRDGVA